MRRPAAPLRALRATIRFDGNARVLSELERPERIALKRPDFSP